MPYYHPQPVQGVGVRPRTVNSFGIALFVLLITALMVLALLYGPGYCGVIAGRARQATVMIVGQEGGPPESGCSGFVINSQGYVLTVAAPLAGGQVFQVVVGSGTRDAQMFDAWPVARGVAEGAASADREWVVLQVDTAEPLVSIEIENSELLRIGDRVTAVGYPATPPRPGGEDSPALEVGSGKAISLREAEVIADCDLTNGTPGGPLLDRAGRAIGLICDIDSEGCIVVPSASLVEVWGQFAGQPQGRGAASGGYPSATR